MTKPITLQSKIEQFRDLLTYYDGWKLGDFRQGIPDFRVMTKLGCTPQNWSRYRPQIIQYCQHNDLIKEEVRDGVTIEIANLRVKYVQKTKEWYAKRNPLKKHDKENGGYRIMTLEELEQYGLVWTAEQDFLY